MTRARWLTMLTLIFGASILAAQDEDKTPSGPKKGDFLPRPFECIHVNGPSKAGYVETKKGQPGYHVPKLQCLVCKFALSPAMVVFAKEPVEGKDAAFTELLSKLDEVAGEFEDRNFQVAVVILSPDARDATNSPQPTDVKDLLKGVEDDPVESAKRIRELSEKLNEEAKKREKLIEGLAKRTEKLKHVIVGCYPSDGPVVTEAPPKGYKLNPKADVTILYYERMKVMENYTFAPGELESKHVESMVTRLRETLPLKKKAAEQK